MLISTINRADMLARLFLEGRAIALVVQEALLAMGFYDVEFEPQAVRATLNGTRWKLGAW